MMFRITPSYDLLLHGTPDTPVGIYHLQLATADQLTRLHYSAGSVKVVKARLKILTEHGFTQADSLPVRQLRSPYFYTLGTQGIHYLHEAGFDTNEAWRAAKEVGKHALFIEHTLELNDVLISAALLHRISPVRLEYFKHERQMKRQPYKTTWQGVALTVIPDAFLKFRLGEKQFRLLLEHDRGTEEQQRFRQKIRGYIALLKEEPITVAFTTFAGPMRLEQLRGWTRKELDGERTDIAAWFYFTNLNRPPSPSIWIDPIWYGSDDQAQRLIAA
jgi:protein involved in plasmid replication-relaxation